MVALDLFAAFHRVEGAMVSANPGEYMIWRLPDLEAFSGSANVGRGRIVFSLFPVLSQ